MLCKTICRFLLLLHLTNHAQGYQTQKAGWLGLLHMLLMLATHKESQTRVDGLLWCRKRPRGGLNSHCYVISSQIGLVSLWIVGGLSIVISEALSASQNQPLLCAGLSSNPVVVQPTGYFICPSQTNWFFLAY